MFPRRYFPGRQFALRFFPQSAASGAADPAFITCVAGSDRSQFAVAGRDLSLSAVAGRDRSQFAVASNVESC